MTTCWPARCAWAITQTDRFAAALPPEGHGITERAHQLDFWDRARAFFDRHLLG